MGRKCWTLTRIQTHSFDDAAGDLDNDGLSNLDEFTNKTFADKPDSDFDGIDDGEEVANETDPTSKLDRDLDGMSNDWERIRGTNWQVDDARVDADGDGVDNIIEFEYRTLPLDATSLPEISTRYVNSATGSDSSGNGSVNAPFATLTSALAVAKTGDTLRLATGSYTLDAGSYNKMISIEGPANRSASISMSNINALGWF